MDSLAFVSSIALRTSSAYRSSVHGRPIVQVFSSRPSRAAHIPIFACAPSDPPAEAEAAPEEPVVNSPEASAEAPTGEPVVEETEAATSEGPTDVVAEESSAADDSKKSDAKRRRRRVKKREVTLPLEDITVGMELDGVVKSVTNYGAFVGDMGTPTDGLLHVSELAAGFVENVTDIVNVGDKLKVRVLSVDTEKKNFSLTMKTVEEMQSDAKAKESQREKKVQAAAEREGRNKKWDEFKFDPNVFIDAKVLSITDFGGFCQLLDEEGVALESSPTDGLIHISELSSERVGRVSDILSEGQVVKVRVVATDKKRNRISLSMRDPGEIRSDKASSASISEALSKANEDQPTFKTSFELAFEKAKAMAKN